MLGGATGKEELDERALYGEQLGRTLLYDNLPGEDSMPVVDVGRKGCWCGGLLGLGAGVVALAVHDVDVLVVWRHVHPVHAVACGAQGGEGA